jgi:hypothetical protein
MQQLTILTPAEVSAIVHGWIARQGSPAAAARALGIGHAYLSRIIHGEKPPRGKLLKRVGLEVRHVVVLR